MANIPVALFSHRDAAEAVQQRLQQAGVPVEIHEELGWEKLWFISKARAGIRLEVRAEDFERAQQFLPHLDAERALEGAVRCPECHSLRVDYPQLTRKSLLTNLAIGLAAEIGLVEKEYYCQDCHFTWPREGARPGRDRPHMAPYYFIEGIEQTRRDPEPHEEKKAA